MSRMPLSSMPVTIPPHRRSRGVALVAVIVAMTIALALFGLWTRMLVQEQRRTELRHFQLQAVRLAEAGVRRGVARQAADSDYQGETWSIPAEVFGGRHTGEVEIRAVPAEDAAGLRIEAAAEFPAGATRRTLVTRHIEIAPPLGNES